MKMNIKKIALFPLISFTVWAYANINSNGIKEIMNTDETITGIKSFGSQMQETPDLKFKDENGQTISLHSLKGKVVFINFWATWCPPCIQEMPSINELRKTFIGNEDLVFLMVDADGKIEKSADWMKKKNFDLPVYISDSQIPRDLFAGALPTTILLDKQNNIVGKQVGGADYSSQEVIDLLNKLLNQ